MAKWFYYDKDGKKVETDSVGLKRLASSGVIDSLTLIESESGKQVMADKVNGLDFADHGAPGSIEAEASIPMPPKVDPVVLPNGFIIPPSLVKAMQKKEQTPETTTDPRTRILIELETKVEWLGGGMFLVMLFVAIFTLGVGLLAFIPYLIMYHTIIRSIQYAREHTLRMIENERLINPRNIMQGSKLNSCVRFAISCNQTTNNRHTIEFSKFSIIESHIAAFPGIRRGLPKNAGTPISSCLDWDSPTGSAAPSKIGVLPLSS